MTPPRGLPGPVEAALALGGLIAAAPLLAVSGALVKLTSPGPVLFRQQRIGKDGAPFTLYKFRTMRRSERGPAFTAGDDVRITRVGKFLRDSKLDELPSLWNIARGELAFVGPRPEVGKYVDPGSPLWRDVLAAKPGITSPMAIELRNEEQLLAAVEGDREAYYREVLLPYKLLGHRDYLGRRTWRSDVAVIVETLAAVARSDRAPPPTLEQVAARVRAYREAESR